MKGSDQLWPQECGCQPDNCHVCRPSWVTPEEWAQPQECAQLTVTQTGNRVVFKGNKSARSGDPLGKGLNTPGLTTRVNLEAPMDSTYPQPDRHRNTGGH